MQVTKKAKTKDSGVEGATADDTQAGERSSAPEPASGTKRRKRKAQDALPAGPADIPAGTSEPGSAKMKKKPKAAAADTRIDVSPSQHAEQSAAAEPVPSAPKHKAPHTAQKKASKRTHMAEGVTSVPAGKSEATDSQPARMQTAQQSKNTGNGTDVGMAEAVDGEVSVEGEISADEAAVVAEQAAHPAGAATGAKPKLTEEQRQERLQRTVFVGNLPATVKAKRLKQAFSQCAASCLASQKDSRSSVVLGKVSSGQIVLLPFLT